MATCNLTPVADLTPIKRFWLLVGPPDANGCRLWLGEISHKGYGRALVGNGHKRAAHRMAWELSRGPLPEGFVLDHFRLNPGVDLPCSRACVALEHLEPVTNRENVLRGRGYTAVNARKKTCPQGHPYTPNVSRDGRSNGRICRVCDRAWKRANSRKNHGKFSSEPSSEPGK